MPLVATRLVKYNKLSPSVGQVMKLSKGKADPKIVGGLVAKKLAAL